MSNAIHICSLARLDETVTATGARFVVTAINPWSIPATPAAVAAENHLKLAVNDIEAPQGDLVHPTPDHIAQLVDFVRRWNRDGPLVVHCLAGISRSSASAFIAACALNPEAGEHTIAGALRRASPVAQPNALMVALADAHLGRSGRMVAAIDALLPGQMTLESAPYQIPSCY